MGLSPGPNQTAADEESENVEEDVDAGDPEASSEHFMAILVECLALLNKVPDTVETIKVEMQAELLAIISRTTQQLLDASQQPGARNTHLLLELLQTVFDQFRRVAAAHASVLRSFARAAEKHHIDVRLYEMPDVWSKVQAVVS